MKEKAVGIWQINTEFKKHFYTSINTSFLCLSQLLKLVESKWSTGFGILNIFTYYLTSGAFLNPRERHFTLLPLPSVLAGSVSMFKRAFEGVTACFMVKRVYSGVSESGWGGENSLLLIFFLSEKFLILGTLSIYFTFEKHQQ